eukprot:1676974-Pyramimonas_sp.AAC.1
MDPSVAAWAPSFVHEQGLALAFALRLLAEAANRRSLRTRRPSSAGAAPRHRQSPEGYLALSTPARRRSASPPPPPPPLRPSPCRAAAVSPAACRLPPPPRPATLRNHCAQACLARVRGEHRLAPPSPQVRAHQRGQMVQHVELVQGALPQLEPPLTPVALRR